MDHSEHNGRQVASSLCHKPGLQRLLAALRLDISYDRGSGASLFYRDASRNEVEVLDLVGGFGSLLLGHSPPVLIDEAQRLLTAGRPSHTQGSRQQYAESLAAELSRRAGGDYCCVFSNSGAEAVEAALKHALLESGGRTFIAVAGAFHGKTLGAVQLIGNAEYREPFELTGLAAVHVPAGDIAALESAFARTTDLAGFIFEPILGEGGVRPLVPEFIRRGAELCAARGVPLIADECQTGTGRTGHFLACEGLAVRPDYILLSKSLGGGLAKIAATLIDRRRYREAFDRQHTSTFATDDFSCALALKTLELLDEPLLAKIRKLGRRLNDELRRLQESYPDVIADVRGSGLMLGVEFRPQTHASSFLLRLLSSQDELLPVLAGYLLHEHRVRALPTLSDPWTLRLQPPVCLDERGVGQFTRALDDVCRQLRANDLPALTSFLLAGEQHAGDEPAAAHSKRQFFAFNAPAFQRRQAQVPQRRIAWLCHMVDADDLTRQEARLGELSYAQREHLLERLSPFACPVVMSSVDVSSAQGEGLRLYPIMLPFTSRTAKLWIDARQLKLCWALIRGGLETARSLGCSLVSLGQYTSIATRNGRGLIDAQIGLTSGNSYTVALALQAVERLLAERCCDPAEVILAVAGAAGNIGSTCAELLAHRFQHTILLGSTKPNSLVRLKRLAVRLPRTSVSFDPADLLSARVIVSAISAIDRPLGAEHFGPEAIVCDVSIPSSVRAGTAALRPDLTIFKGGVVRLPGGEDLEIA